MKAPNWLERLFGRGRPLPPESEPGSPHTTLEQVLGYSFARADLLETALTHPSAAVGSDVHYERLEFLGDAVLGLCVSEMLSAAYADADEGKLTRMRSALVNADALAAWGRRVALGWLL